MSTLGLLWAAISWVVGTATTPWANMMAPEETQFFVAGGASDGHCG